MRQLLQRLAVSMVVGTMSCASAGSRQSDGAPAASAETSGASTSKSNSSTLVAEDLQRIDVPNLADAIQRLRPQWLRRSQMQIPNGRQASSTPIVVWVDNIRAGGPEILSQINVSSVRSVRYFSPSEAEARFGNGHTNGAIQVTTTTGAKP